MGERGVFYSSRPRFFRDRSPGGPPLAFSRPSWAFRRRRCWTSDKASASARSLATEEPRRRAGTRGRSLVTRPARPARWLPGPRTTCEGVLYVVFSAEVPMLVIYYLALRALVTLVGLGERGRLHDPILSRQLHCASRNAFPGRQRTWYIRPPLSLSCTSGKPVPSLMLPEGSPQPAQHRRSLVAFRVSPRILFLRAIEAISSLV